MSNDEETLFPEYELELDSIQVFKNAIATGLVDNLCVYSLARMAYNRGKMKHPILAVDELTIIPAWRDMCKKENIATIEASPNHGLYMLMNQSKVENVTSNAYRLLNENDIRAIYSIWLHN